MKILIKDIEKQIPYKIKRNFKVIGVDGAQVTGVVVLKTDEEYIDIDYMVLSFKTKDHKEIYHSMISTFARLFEQDQLAILEQVFVGFSRAGSIELARYSSFAIAECIKKGMEWELISAVSARAKFDIDTRLLGKGRTKECVMMWIKKRLGIKFTDNNIADAFILALIGMCEGMDFRPKKEIAKAKKQMKRK